MELRTTDHGLRTTSVSLLLSPLDEDDVRSLIDRAHARPEPRWRRRHQAEGLSVLRRPRLERLPVVEAVRPDVRLRDVLARLARAVPVACAAVPLAVDEREDPLIA